MHNSLQGSEESTSKKDFDTYLSYNEANSREIEFDQDLIVIHDPQPAALIAHHQRRKNKWVWRCHIDLSRPFRPVWRYLRNLVVEYDASIFSMPDFSQPLPHLQYIIPPSIDPLTEKNRELPPKDIEEVLNRFGLDPHLPIILQVSRFDRFKDPLGVIRAARLAKKFVPLQLVLAGGGAADDPEGEAVLKEVQAAAAGDPHIHILYLPPDAHKTINALQRAADVVIQKSLKEGFGLTVTEALWKGKPVIGGAVGGIKIQVVNHHTGFLVHTPEGAALRIRYLLFYKDKREEMGRKAHLFAKENFLITRHLRDYLSLLLALKLEAHERIELET